VLLSSIPSFAAECAEAVSTMRQANVRYRNGVNELRVMQRDLGPAGLRSDEAVLRSLRRYAFAQRELHEQRLHIIALYRGLVDAECEPFDRQGYEATLDDFRLMTEAEQRVLSEARQVMTATASIR
jgi:hypothetical protein